MHREEEKNAPEPQEPASAKVAEQSTTLDLDEVDLSVEVVEERISPSETNVFDK